jgi:hypothetical protein
MQQLSLFVWLKQYLALLSQNNDNCLAVAVLSTLAEIGLVADGVSNLPRIKTGCVAKTGGCLVKQHLYLVFPASDTFRRNLRESWAILNTKQTSRNQDE